MRICCVANGEAAHVLLMEGKRQIIFPVNDSCGVLRVAAQTECATFTESAGKIFHLTYSPSLLSQMGGHLTSPPGLVQY